MLTADLTNLKASSDFVDVSVLKGKRACGRERRG